MGISRENAITRMRRALSGDILRGIETTIPFQQAIMHAPDFFRGQYGTGFAAKPIGARGSEFGKTRV